MLLFPSESSFLYFISTDESGSNRVEMMEMQPLLGPGSETERGGRQAVDALEDQEREEGRQAVDALEDQEAT